MSDAIVDDLPGSTGSSGTMTPRSRSTTSSDINGKQEQSDFEKCSGKSYLSTDSIRSHKKLDEPLDRPKRAKNKTWRSGFAEITEQIKAMGKCSRLRPGVWSP